MARGEVEVEVELRDVEFANQILAPKLAIAAPVTAISRCCFERRRARWIMLWIMFCLGWMDSVDVCLRWSRVQVSLRCLIVIRINNSPSRAWQATMWLEHGTQASYMASTIAKTAKTINHCLLTTPPLLEILRLRK